MNLQRLSLHLVTYGKGNAFDLKKFQAVKNRDHIKPAGGLWASPVNSSFGWREWCIENEWGNLETNFQFSYTGVVLKIDSAEDAATLPWRSIHRLISFPDYETIARMGVGAIWLTTSGEQETRFTLEHSLYGWDCESVLILNPSGIR